MHRAPRGRAIRRAARPRCGLLAAPVALGLGRHGLRAAQHQARLADAVPLVDLEREGRLRAARRRRPAAARRSRTPPPARGRRAELTVKRTCLPSPIGRASAKLASATISDTLGLPRPNGASACSSSASAMPSSSPPHDRVHALAPAPGPLGCSTPSRVARERRREVADPRRARSPGPRRRGGRRSRAGAPRTRRSPPSRSKASMLRPEPLPVSPSSAISTTGRPLRSTSREATIPITPGVPALAREHVRRALAERGHLRFGLEADPQLHLAGARGWRASSSARDLRGARGILGEDQLERRVGAVQAPGGVQARRQREADARARRRCAGSTPRDRHQRAQPGLGRARQRAQPAAHERAVLAHQRHDVGDRRERHQVEVLLAGLARGSPAPPRGHRPRCDSACGELVGDRRRAQLAARIAAQPPGARSARAAARRRRAARGGR